MITVVAPDDLMWIPALERGASKGDHIEVPDQLGASLVAQGWKTVETKKTKSEAPAATDKTEPTKEV